MRASSSKSGFPIDAVITWVDGADPLHKAKRLAHLMPTRDQLHENGINPHRWACSDELSFCLASIENNAPWIGTIYIVTDGQTPDLSHLSPWVRDRVKIVDHLEIFEGYESALPTFNSLAIESMLWRIKGLAEHFIYFNDDVFLTGPLQPRDVFDGQGPVLRGKWVDHSGLGQSQNDFVDPTLFHDFMQTNAATLLGFDRARLFASAHVVHPLKRSVFEALFARFEPEFVANIAHKFREISQFQPQSLHNGACIEAGTYRFAPFVDYLHLRTGALEDYGLGDVRAYLRKALNPAIKFLCINDLRQVEAAIPDARDWIEAAIAPRKAAA
jgi:Stealth protein CR2, conserved region 2/Stealth protein CR1, conserved region 1